MLLVCSSCTEAVDVKLAAVCRFQALRPFSKQTTDPCSLWLRDTAAVFAKRELARFATAAQNPSRQRCASPATLPGHEGCGLLERSWIWRGPFTWLMDSSWLLSFVIRIDLQHRVEVRVFRWSWFVIRFSFRVCFSSMGNSIDPARKGHRLYLTGYESSFVDYYVV